MRTATAGTDVLELVTPVREAPAEAPAMALLVNVGGHQYQVDLAEIWEQVSAGHKAARGLTYDDARLLSLLVPLVLGGTWEGMFGDGELDRLEQLRAAGLTDSYYRDGATIWGITHRGRLALAEVR